jgi:hypothetical protein
MKEIVKKKLFIPMVCGLLCAFSIMFFLNHVDSYSWTLHNGIISVIGVFIIIIVSIILSVIASLIADKLKKQS